MPCVKQAIWINGQVADQVAVTDRGLQYGDGFFTTVLLIHGQKINWSAHLARLMDSAERLGFQPLGLACLESHLSEFLQANSLETEQILKIMITRGSGGQGYQKPAVEAATQIFQLYPFPKNTQNLPKNHQAWFSAKKVMLCQTRWGSHRQLAGLKHLNRLENVLARSELLLTDFDEGIMLDQQGFVISGTQSNLCWLQNGQWWTADLTDSGVAGTTLARLKADYSIQSQKITFDELMQASEIFFCNAVRGIQPVFELNGQIFNTEQGQAIALAWQEFIQLEVADLG